MVHFGQQLHHILRVVAQQHHKEQINLRQQILLLAYLSNIVDLTDSLQPSRNTALSPSRFIPEIRLPASHPGRTRSKPILNPNPPTRIRIKEHAYLFALDHKTWNPPTPLYGPTNFGDTLTNWSRNRLIDTLNLTAQRNAALNVLTTPTSDLKSNTTIKYDTIFNHPFHATTPSIITTTNQHHQSAPNSYINLIDTPSKL